MSHPSFPALAPPARDSFELASLASSAHDSPARTSLASSSSGLPSSRKNSLSEPPRPQQYGARRSYSVSSAFDFSSAMFPLSSSGAGYTALGTPLTPNFDLGAQSLERNKSLTFLNGLSLVVGLVIGSGIFSSPASVNSNAGSPGAALIVWVVAGLLAWTGAASYAELGGAIPLNGGAQVYLSKIFGEWAGFLFTWCAVVVLKPGSAAIIALIFGEYVVRAFIGAEATDVSPWINKGVGLLGLVLVTLLNGVSTKLGARAADVFMFLKFVALLAITILGITVAATGWSYHRDLLSHDWKNTSWFAGTSTSTSSWAVALYAGLWAYDGWDNTNYVVGEMVNPARDLPRTIHTSLPLVILAYVLANLAYIFVLPLATINASNTVAVAFGSTVLGPIGSLVLALTVSGSCFGALNATTFTAGRLVYAAGKEGYIPSVFGSIGLSTSSTPQIRLPRRSSSRAWKKYTRFLADDAGFFATPLYALALNLVLTAIYLAIGDFTTLTTFYGVASYLFYFAAVVGLIVLRIKEPELERPYKCWIGTPVVFCCVSLFLLSRAVFAKPLQALVVLAFIVVGVPLYWWRVGGKGKSGRRERGDEVGWWKFWRRWGGVWKSVCVCKSLSLTTSQPIFLRTKDDLPIEQSTIAIPPTQDQFSTVTLSSEKPTDIRHYDPPSTISVYNKQPRLLDRERAHRLMTRPSLQPGMMGTLCLTGGEDADAATAAVSTSRAVQLMNDHSSAVEETTGSPVSGAADKPTDDAATLSLPLSATGTAVQINGAERTDHPISETNQATDQTIDIINLPPLREDLSRPLLFPPSSPAPPPSQSTSAGPGLRFKGISTVDLIDDRGTARGNETSHAPEIIVKKIKPTEQQLQLAAACRGWDVVDFGL